MSGHGRASGYPRPGIHVTLLEIFELLGAIAVLLALAAAVGVL